MSDLPGYVVDAKDGALLSVFVQPRAAKDELVGVHGTALKLKVKAPPQDGRANQAVCALLARLLELRPSQVSVVSGAASRHKRVAVPLSAQRVVSAITPVLSSRAPKTRRGSKR